MLNVLLNIYFNIQQALGNFFLSNIILQVQNLLSL